MLLSPNRQAGQVPNRDGATNPSKGNRGENVGGRSPTCRVTVDTECRVATCRGIVQNPANGVKFGQKETYMEGLNYFILHNQVGRAAAAAASASGGTKAKSCTACCNRVRRCDLLQHSASDSAKCSRHATCTHAESCTSRVVCVGRRSSGVSGCAANALAMWTRAE